MAALTLGTILGVARGILQDSHYAPVVDGIDQTQLIHPSSDEAM